MYGRYGNDQLNNLLITIALVVGVVSLFINGVAGLVLYVLQMLLLGFWACRAFSRNHYNRRKENSWYLTKRNKLKTRFSSVSAFFRRVADRQHKYFKCPNCGIRLRVPRGRGEITVTCPKCKNRFDKKS